MRTMKMISNIIMMNELKIHNYIKFKEQRHLFYSIILND